MFEQEVQIPAPDGTADGVLITPARDGRWPGVVMLTDMGGIRDSQRAMASRLADKGYAVLLPNLFYRSGHAPFFPSPMPFTDPGAQSRAAQLRAELTPDAATRDGAAYADFLSKHANVTNGPLAVIGYCFTGGMAMRTAAARPGVIAAAAAFHGVGLATDAATSPHLVLSRIKARLYFGHAAGDRSMPTEAIEKLEHALTGWGGTYESEVYEGVAHGWTVPDHPHYNQADADRAFGKLTALLAATLKPETSKRHA